MVGSETITHAMSSDLAPSSAETTSPAEPAPVPRGLVTSASYSITVRLTADGDPASIGRIATAVGSAGGAVTAIDVVDSRSDGLTVDVTCSAADAAHSEEMVEALRNVQGVTVKKVSDRTYSLDAQDDGGTVLTVREDHSGPLAGLLGRTTPDLNPSFRQFCSGLKARTEGQVPRPAG